MTLLFDPAGGAVVQLRPRRNPFAGHISREYVASPEFSTLAMARYTLALTDMRWHAALGGHELDVPTFSVRVEDTGSAGLFRVTLSADTVPFGALRVCTMRPPRDEILFFGAYRSAGHYLREPGGRMADARRMPDALQPYRLDGTLTPRDGLQRQGRACLHHVAGWTVVAWWDRAVDERMGSNSAFLMRGTHTFHGVLLAGANAFPELLPRFAMLEQVP